MGSVEMDLLEECNMGTGIVPRTVAVLNTIGSRGIIVGSVAMGARWVKDVDVVIPYRKDSEPRNPIFQRLLTQFRSVCVSEVVGHLWVEAVPLPVEVFESDCWLPTNPAKHAGVLSYRQALLRAQPIKFLGKTYRAAARGITPVGTRGKGSANHEQQR